MGRRFRWVRDRLLLGTREIDPSSHPGREVKSAGQGAQDPPESAAPENAVGKQAASTLTGSSDQPSPFPGRTRRTAILVVHGMGAQKPYATLDQFGRGLIALFGGETYVKQQINFRYWPANPINKQSDWTQAFLRITPIDSHFPDQVIDVFEYYWAPVINDLVTAKQSLRFLIFSALTPFQYLRDNLILMNQISQKRDEIGDAPAVSMKVKRSGRATLIAMQILFREFVRMLFIFLPLIAVFCMVYSLIAQPLLKNTGMGPQTFFRHWPLSVHEGIALSLTALRFLFIAMTGLFLFEEFFGGFNQKTRTRSPLAYRIVMVCLFLLLLFAPWLFGVLPRFTARHVLYGAAVLTAIVPLSSPVFRDASRRAVSAMHRHAAISTILISLAGLAFYLSHYHPGIVTAIWLWLQHRVVAWPPLVIWREVAKYALLATLLFAVNKFLTSAIGGLAVYLGADELSKNYAARSQILHECSDTLLKILGMHSDLAAPTRADNRYDQVLIAAHSLGSVISYDMLNQLLVRQQAMDPAVLAVDLQTITGMLTFGCPLNKVIYFFRARTSRTTTILERILFVLHPFRLRVPISNDANGPIRIPHPYPSHPPFGGLNAFRWRNAYSPFDLISGKMFFYDADDNARIERGVMPWTAHVSYWENPKLYEFFLPLL